MPTKRQAKRSNREYAPRLAPHERRDQLLDAALRIGVESGFDEITMAAVAEECGVTRPVVYSQFANGNELLSSVFEREVNGAMADLALAVPQRAPENDPRASYMSSIATFINAVRHHRYRWQFILVPPHGVPNAVRDEVAAHRRRIEDEMERATRWHIGPEALDASLLSVVVVGVLEKIATVIVSDPERFSDEEVLFFAGQLFDALSGWPSAAVQ